MSGADLVLIDGSSYLYRAFHALPSLTNSHGEPTGALHGVLNMINKLVREEQATHIAVVFDAPGKTFRDDLFAAYKATRPPMPDDLRSQVEPILAAVKAMGLPLLQITGVEADDVIGTLCKRGADAGLKVLVSTGDKDMAQLVNDHVTLVNTMSDSVLDRAAVKEKFDVFPEQIIDYLALVGDTSDNIPGVPKVGAKTAAKWLNQYGSADGIVAHADEITGKVGDSLRESIEQLRLSQQLATIKLDVDLPLTIDELQRGSSNTEDLRSIFGRYELRTLLRQVEESSAATVVAPAAAVATEDRHYETVLDWPAFDRWLEKIRTAQKVGLFTSDQCRPRWLAFRLLSPRATPPTVPSRMTTPARRISCHAPRFWKDFGVFSRIRVRTKSDIISNMMPMYCSGMASNLPACALTQCWNRMY